MTGRWGIAPDADLVVSIRGDGLFHLIHTEDLRRPACGQGGRGLVTPRKDAEQSGLVPCETCRSLEEGRREEEAP